MLKPIKPKKYIAGDTGLKFARKILERKAMEGLYDFSEAELVFALGKSAEQDSVLSVLELLDTLLGILKNGIGFRGGRSIFVYARGVLNLAENILQRGGVSEEYRCAVDIYNELKEKLYSFSDKTSTYELDSLKEKLTEAVNSIKSSKTEHLTQIKSKRSNAFKTDVISTKAFGAASVGVLRMTARNPELFKSVRSNRAFLELALKCEEKQRRGFKLRRRFSMLVDELSERQTEFLRNFILENGLFSKTIEAGENTNELNNSKSILEFIANRSSFNELEKFFSTFERRISSERHYNTERGKVFSSAGEMREFFKSADIPQLESFAEYLKSNSLQEQGSEIMQNALDEYISLTRKLSELLQRTMEMIGQNAEFSDYSREKLFENAGFAEIYSELNSLSKENVTEKIYGENSEFVLSYGEYAVNRVRESGDVGAELRKSAEKIERILYYEQSESSLKADEIREIISSASSEALKEFAEMLKEFTGTDRLSITSRALYEYIGRFALNERLSEAEKLLKHVVRYNSNAEALEGEIERFAENNGSFSFWSVLERLGAADKLTGLYSVDNRTFERFSEWLESQLSDNESFSETTELIRAYSETRGLSESFERLISEIKYEKNSPEEYEKAYAEFERTAENILTLIENSESTLEEELAVISEKLERFSEKDLADRAEIISEVERVFSALEEKEQLPSELSELLKLQLSENSNVNVEDLKRIIEGIVSALEEKEQLSSELSKQIKLQLSENSNVNAEDLKMTIESIVSALEEKEQLSSELSKQIKLQLSENSNVNVEDLKRTIESIVSALEEKEQFPSELSEQIKLQFSENSSVTIDDLKRTIENVVSVFEQREIAADVLPNELRTALESFVKYRESKLQRNEISERKFTSSELSELLDQRENFSDMYEGDLEFISKTLEYLKISENDLDKEDISDVSREINYVLDNIDQLEYTLPKNLELVSRSIERFKLSETESSKIAVTEELMRCLEEPMIRLYADSEVLSEFARISREFQTGKVKTSEIEREYERLIDSLVSSYRSNAVNFEELKTEFKTLSNSYSEMTALERLRAFEKFPEQLSLCNSQGMIGGELFSDVLKAVERIKRINVENLLKFADERTNGLATVYYQVSKLLKNVRKSIEEDDREHFTELLKDLDEMFSDEKIYQTSVLSEIKSLMSNVDEYSNKEQNEFEKSIEIAAENIRLVYAQSLIKSKLNTERETVNSLKSELEELKSDFSQKTENSERIEHFTENVLRSFIAVKNKSLTENETADFKRLSEYLERSNNLNERSDLSRRKFTRELFEAITSDVTEERLNSAFFGNEIRAELVQKLYDKETRESEKFANEKTFVEINNETSFSEYQNKLSKQIDVNYRELNDELLRKIGNETFETKTDTYKEYETLSDMVYREKEHKEDLNSVSEKVISRSEQKVSDIIENHLKEQESLAEIEKRMISSENESNEINEHKFTSSEFSELVMNNKTVNLGPSEKFAREIIKAITYDETAKSISNTLNDIKNVLGTAGTAVFGIKQINSAAKSVVADKTLYKAVRNFYGEHTDELADFIEQKAYDYDLFYLRAGDNSEIFQENKLFRFSHDAVSRQIERELSIHTAKAANSPYERIYSRLAEQNERSDYSGAELFYTEEYFESPRGSVSVNYAVNAGKAEKSEEVSERLSGLNGKLEDISREIAEVRRSEQEMSTRFVLKSESSILEREIKSSIERDILLAGKRHGVL